MNPIPAHFFRDVYRPANGTVTFLIDGQPKAWERFVPVQKGKKKLHGINSKDMRDAKEYIGWIARPWFSEPYEGPVGLTMRYVLRNRRSEPDIDNLEKMILDSLEGIAYKNDKQVARVTHEKFVRRGEEKFGTLVTVQRLEVIER